MRTLCDACESAPAILFCAADEAALCRVCDEKVHMCNKLASRHVRVGLDAPSDVPRCDICENAPAFFYCEVDGSSLCLQCDMVVHVGGKRTHERYLLLRQKFEFLGDKPGPFEDPALQSTDPVQFRRDRNQLPQQTTRERNTDDHDNRDSIMIDLNARPHRIQGQASNGQRAGNRECASAVPMAAFKRDV